MTDAQLYVALAAYIALSLTIGIISARRFAKTNPEPIWVPNWDGAYWRTVPEQIITRGALRAAFWPIMLAFRILRFAAECIWEAAKLVFVPRGMR